MGTHGQHGWQHITGSHALKVITHSTIPFIVVQEKNIKETGYDDIVVPLDLSKETKQKLAYVANIATYFNSRVHLITPDESDEFLKRQVVFLLVHRFCCQHNESAELSLQLRHAAGILSSVPLSNLAHLGETGPNYATFCG
jgi:nucleotide-binding universal stress UspA family protein